MKGAVGRRFNRASGSYGKPFGDCTWRRLNRFWILDLGFWIGRLVGIQKGKRRYVTRIIKEHLPNPDYDPNKLY